MRKLSVLIADDDEALRAVLRFVVESRGHQRLLLCEQARKAPREETRANRSRLAEPR